jgi:propionyl-CoA carboxylase beta chain
MAARTALWAPRRGRRRQRRLAHRTDRGPQGRRCLRLELQQHYEDTLVNPYIAAERGYVDAVIPPSHTRGYVATALRLLERKITQVPPKKHGNIPL